jgi:hypothetical protein
MPYSYGPPADNFPFLPSDGVVTSEPLGTFTSRKLGDGATAALVAFSERMADDRAGRSGWSSHRSRHSAELDAQLERLGVRASRQPLQRTRVFDLPL